MASRDEDVRVAAMLPPKERRMLHQLAQRNDRSIAAEVRIAIRKHLGLLKDAA